MVDVHIDLHTEGAQFATSSFPQFRRGQGTNFPVVGLSYDAASDEEAFWKFTAIDYGSGNLTLEIQWYADTASSGTVRWAAAIAAITPNTDTQDIETKAFATEQAVDDAHLGTTGRRLHVAELTITNLDSLATDDVVWLKLKRDADHANDTMAGDAILVGARIKYTGT